MLAAAQKVFDEVSCLGKQFPTPTDQAPSSSSYLSEEAEAMRWFLLPSEARQVLLGQTTHTVTPIFKPRCYPEFHLPNPVGNNVSRTDVTLLQNSRLQENKYRNMESADVVGLNREELRESEKRDKVMKFHCPPKNIYKPTTEVYINCH